MTHIVLAGIWIATVCPVLAQSFYLTPDIPTDLGGTTFLPWEVVRHHSGVASSELLLPVGTPVDALHHMDGGDWLLSVASPTDLGGTVYQSEDVIRFDGANFSMFFDGSAEGVPPGAGVDSVFLDGGDGGDLVVGFDVPISIGSNITYEPADLVRFDGASFSWFFDTSAATPAIPVSSNVTGADRRGFLTVLTFDVPTTLGGATFLPGELVSWNGHSFASFFSDPSWPLSSRLDGLAFLADPGRTPPTLLMDKWGFISGDLRLSWSASCSAGAEDYGIYEGLIGSWYSHVPIDCSDNGNDLIEVITPSAGDRYYLVVPQNANDGRSHGTDSSGSERPTVFAACTATQVLNPCP